MLSMERGNELKSNMKDLVRDITKEKVWPNCKFLNDNMISNAKLEDYPKFSKSVAGTILYGIRKQDMDLADRVTFWKVHSGVVKKELNVIKKNVAKSMKDAVIKGIVAIVFFCLLN